MAICFPIDVQRVLGVSVAFTDIDWSLGKDENEPLEDIDIDRLETLCQDVQHSLYCSYSEIKELHKEYIGSVHTDIGELVLMYLISQVLRPFCAKWHNAFFRNTEWQGYMAVSEPREADESEINAYIQAFGGLVLEVTEFYHILSKPEGSIRDYLRDKGFPIKVK